jgi:hypothetical protein
MIENAIRRNRGTIPLVHDAALLLGELGEMSEASFQDGASAKRFEASVYVLVLWRLKDRWDDKPQLFDQRSALVSRCERLSKLTSDMADVIELREVATLATDITTIGCLSMYAEANNQWLSCQALGEPLIATVAHLYIYQRIRKGDSKTSFVLDRICEKFAHLLFWDGVPKDRGTCKDSLENWILDSKLRSLRPRETGIIEELFQKRNTAPTVVGLAEILFGSKDLAASNHRSASGSKVVSPGPSTLLEMESDFRDFLAISMLLKVTEECTNVVSIGSKNSKVLALHLGYQMIRGNNDFDILTGIVGGLEKFQYQQPWWLQFRLEQD